MQERTLAEMHWDSLIEQNDYIQAERFYEKTKKQQQLTPSMSYVMGLWHHQRENFHRAAEAFVDGLIMAPNSSELYYAMGNTMREMGQTSSALSYYRNAILFDPDYIDAYFSLGQMLGQMDQKDDAVKCFCKALNLATNTQERIAIAVEFSYLELADYAIQVYFAAMVEDPDNYYLYSNLGVEFAEQDAFKDALFCHEKALALTRDDGDVWYNAACTYALCGEELQSLLALEKAIELDPDNVEFAAEDTELENLHHLKRFWALLGRKEIK